MIFVVNKIVNKGGKSNVKTVNITDSVHAGKWYLIDNNLQ